MDRDEILKKAQAGAIGMDERSSRYWGCPLVSAGSVMVAAVCRFSPLYGW